jgi:hypothetical protein
VAHSHQCPVKYFAEFDKALTVRGLRRLLPCRDLNGDWLQEPALRRTSAEVEAGRRSRAAAGAALRTFPGMAYRLPFNVRRHIMEK